MENGSDTLASGHYPVLPAMVRQRSLSRPRLDVTARIGIDYAAEWRDAPLRFALRGSPHLSR